MGAPGEGAENRETEDTDETGHGVEDEVRFALTSEAGLNDGLAFPFTNMAIAMAMAGAAPSNWFQTWLLIDVLYKLTIGALVGLGLGFALAHLIFAMPAKTSLAKSMVGLGALAATLLIYGVTQYIDGYGFIAVFIGAFIIRHTEPRHEYHPSLHALTEKTERLLTALILIALGAAIANGLLEPLTWQLVVCALLIIFLIRPFASIIGLLGHNRAPWRERLAISFFGIRGIGSPYYLSFALNEEDFSDKAEIWALVGLVVVISVIVQGTTAAPVISKLDELREKENTKSA